MKKEKALCLILSILILCLSAGGCSKSFKTSEGPSSLGIQDFTYEEHVSIGDSYDILTKDSSLSVEREYNSFSLIENGKICAVGSFINTEAAMVYKEKKYAESQILELDEEASVVIYTADEKLVSRIEFVDKA